MDRDFSDITGGVLARIESYPIEGGSVFNDIAAGRRGFALPIAPGAEIQTVQFGRNALGLISGSDERGHRRPPKRRHSIPEYDSLSSCLGGADNAGRVITEDNSSLSDCEANLGITPSKKSSTTPGNGPGTCAGKTCNSDTGVESV